MDDLARTDPEVAEAIRNETRRQGAQLELIASENFVSEAVLEALGTVFTNKYAEGYPGRRYYGGCKEDERIDYGAILDLARQHRPKVIVVGASAYPRTIDFVAVRRAADESGAVIMADIAHIAGLIAAGIHPSPIPHAEFVTSTTHKTLRGPRGGLVMCQEKWAKELDKLVFPRIQGGPPVHVLAAKAV